MCEGRRTMIKKVFALENPFKQVTGGTQQIGVCTVASLKWAKQCLLLGRGLGNQNELGASARELNGLMAVWRRFDSTPEEQTTGMGLRMVGNDRPVTMLREVQRIVRDNPPHVAIFFNSHHTMGYRWSAGRNRFERAAGGSMMRKEVEYFDMEDGLWWSDDEWELLEKMKEIFAAKHYAQVMGVRVVELPT